MPYECFRPVTTMPLPWYIDWLWLLILAACILGFLFMCCWFIVFCRWCYNRRKRLRNRHGSSNKELTANHVPGNFPHVKIPTRFAGPSLPALPSTWKRWKFVHSLRLEKLNGAEFTSRTITNIRDNYNNKLVYFCALPLSNFIAKLSGCGTVLTIRISRNFIKVVFMSFYLEIV